MSGPDLSQNSSRTKMSWWQRFKSFSLIKKFVTVIVVFFAATFGLAVFAMIVDPEGFAESQERVVQEREERAAEREAEREAAEEEQKQEEEAAKKEEEEAAKKEAEEERQQEEEEERAAKEKADEEREAKAKAEEEEERAAKAKAEEEETAVPDGIDTQLALLSEERDFDDAEIYFAEADDSFPHSVVEVNVEAGPGWSESSMCRSARAQTIRGLQFMRDRVTEDYDNVRFSYHTRSEADATGDSSILGMAVITYDQETVQAIQDDSITIDNVWDVADDGGLGVVCQRAE